MTNNQDIITEFGKQIFDADSGKDPYLENTQTLWLLHWNLCQGWMEGERHRRPYAWHHFVNKLRDDEITATETVDHFQGAETPSGRELSGVTLRQHFDVFLRTYVDGETSGPRALPEDTLDSPLTPLRLIRPHGEKKNLSAVGGKLFTASKTDPNHRCHCSRSGIASTNGGTKPTPMNKP